MPMAKNFSRFLTLVSLGGAACFAGPVFSLKTNSDFPTLGSDFALLSGKVQPFVGVSNYSFRVKTKDTYTPDQSGLSSSSSTAATVFVTSLGLRIHFRDQGLKPYLYGNLYKLFTIIDADGNSAKEDDEIEQIYSPFGCGAGFGGEYPVSDKFAVFGEYGVRALFPSAETTETDTFDNSQHKAEISMMFSALNGAAGIRFYF
jgi:hypothetical protein